MGRNKKEVTELRTDVVPAHDFDTFAEMCRIYRQGCDLPMSVKGVVYQYVKGKGWVKADELGNDQVDSITESIFTNE